MSDERFDVIVIGAGPAGSTAAAGIASRGYSVLLLEKRSRIGFPVRCAEAIGPASEIERYVELDEKWISSPVDGFLIVSPGGKRFEGRIPGIGYVVDREGFDLSLAEKARERGAEIRTGHQAMELIRGELGISGVVVRDLASGSEYRALARIVIGADGIESLSVRWAGIRAGYSPDEVLSCAQQLVRGIDVSSRQIEFHLGSATAPGGYAWVFPKSEDSANVGLGINALMAGGVNASEYLERFLERRCPGAERKRLVVGGTVVARGLEHLSVPGFAAAGEAACQNNPFTGGGILNAIAGGGMAADAAAEALERQGGENEALERYTARWNGSAGRSNELYFRAAKVFYRLSDRQLDRALDRLSRVPGLIDEKGMDPRKVFRALFLSNPVPAVRIALSLLLAGKGRSGSRRLRL